MIVVWAQWANESVIEAYRLYEAIDFGEENVKISLRRDYAIPIKV